MRRDSISDALQSYSLSSASDGDSDVEQVVDQRPDVNPQRKNSEDTDAERRSIALCALLQKFDKSKALDIFLNFERRLKQKIFTPCLSSVDVTGISN